MLKKEFEERIGRSASLDEFTEANGMYMAAGEMDKDEFCREWKQVGQSRLVQCLYNTAYNLNEVLQEKNLLLSEAHELRSEIGDRLLLITDDALSGAPQKSLTHELESLTYWILGQKEVVCRKVKKDYLLNDNDREFIIESLRK